MGKSDMKKLFTENIGLKIISVIVAIILWLTIVYTYDPAKTADFTIPVTVVNGDSITNLGKVYDVVEGSNVTIRAKAKTSIINSLKASDFKATADVSKLSPTMNANIDVTCTKSSNVEISFVGSVKMLKVKLEELVTKQFPVTVNQNGTPAEGYYVGSSSTKPNLITVSGGESTIDQISTISVDVNVDGANRTFFSEAEPSAYDSTGTRITSDTLSFSSIPVSVTTKVYETKEVAIFVETNGNPYEGYTAGDVDYEPKSVIIAGNDSDLSGVTSLTLSLDVSGKITDVEETLPLSDALPTNVFLTDPDTTVSVKCKINRIDSREIALGADDIKLTDTDEGFDYIVTGASVNVTLKGLKDDINSVTVSKLSPTVDMAGFSMEGTYNVKLSFNEVEGVSVEGTPEVTIEVVDKTKKEEPDNTATDSGITDNGGNASDNGAGDNTDNNSGRSGDNNSDSSSTGSDIGSEDINSDIIK
ncbi:MAG: CdaR family protein [Catonella sp.]|nr:CdaR family protein [Catonella sp.]